MKLKNCLGIFGFDAETPSNSTEIKPSSDSATMTLPNAVHAVAGSIGTQESHCNVLTTRAGAGVGAGVTGTVDVVVGGSVVVVGNVIMLQIGYEVHCVLQNPSLAMHESRFPLQSLAQHSHHFAVPGKPKETRHCSQDAGCGVGGGVGNVVGCGVGGTVVICGNSKPLHTLCSRQRSAQNPSSATQLYRLFKQFNAQHLHHLSVPLNPKLTVQSSHVTGGAGVGEAVVGAAVVLVVLVLIVVVDEDVEVVTSHNGLPTQRVEQNPSLATQAARLPPQSFPQHWHHLAEPGEPNPPPKQALQSNGAGVGIGVTGAAVVLVVVVGAVVVVVVAVVVVGANVVVVVVVVLAVVVVVVVVDWLVIGLLAGVTVTDAAPIAGSFF